MAQATLTESAPIPGSVATKLRSLRAKITLWLLIDGISRALLAAVALIAVDFLLDWQFSFDRNQRIVMLALCGTTIGYVIYKRLLIPLFTGVSDDALCLAVERHYGRELNESLITAVQFSRMGEGASRGVSPQLVQASIDQGIRAADRIPFGSIVDSGWLFANAAILACCTAALAAFFWSAEKYRPAQYDDTYYQLAGIWVDRDLLLMDRPWPQDTYLTVQGADGQTVTLPRGDDWSLLVEVDPRSKIKPDEVLLDVATRSGSRSEVMETVEKEKLFRVDFSNVVDEFRFRARTRRGRGATAWHRVKLVNRPEIASLTLTTTLPPYAGGKDEELPAGAGPYHVLAGSAMQVRGVSDKPLSAATLILAGKADDAKLVSVPMTVGGKDRTEFSCRIAPAQLQDGAYRMELLDTEELLLPGRSERGPLASSDTQRFVVRIKPDRAPDVVARLTGITGMVVPKARLPIDCLIKDQFAVTSAVLKHQWRHEDNAAEVHEAQYDIASAKEQLGGPKVAFTDVFDLEPLGIPVGSGLSFFIEAADSNDISGPGIGKSTVFLLRVVSEDELRADLLRREKEQRFDFERLVKNQDDMQIDCQALDAALREAAGLSGDQRQLLLTLQKNHKLLSNNIGSVADRLEAILAEYENNRLYTDEDAQQRERLVERIIRPMRELAEADVPLAMRELDKVRLYADDAQPRSEALADVVGRHAQIAEKMQEILRHLVKSEGYQEAVNLLYEIRKTQEQVKELTAKERERLIQRILEGKSPDEVDPPAEDPAEKPAQNPARTPQP
ncbi:MAG: hypothetical protein KDA41_13750 [Planctomycetales bacterium]|nr:hypothetical protein [Planctomycetales bacterium]